MLPKSERLTKEDFKNIRPKVFFRGVCFDVASVPSPHFKCACVISKKKVKTAVERNKIKRRIFNFISRNSLAKPYMLIFYIKNQASLTDYESLKKEILQAFDTLQ